MPEKKADLKTKKAKLSVQKESNKASRFVIDLKSTRLKTPEAVPDRQHHLKNYLYDYIEKEAAKPKQTVKADNQPKPPKPKRQLLAKLKTSLSQLAIFNLFKLSYWLVAAIGRMFYQLCFAFGWLAVFAVRFVYLLVFTSTKNLGVSSKKALRYFYAALVSLRPQPKAKTEPVLEQAAKKTKAVAAASATAPTAKRQEKSNQAAAPIKTAERRFVFNLKPLVAFVLVLLILILPLKLLAYYKSLDSLKDGIIGSADEAVKKMVTAGKSAAGMDFNAASNDFSQAGSNFLKAQNQLAEINGFLLTLAGIVPNKELRLASESKHIIAAGSQAAAMGENLSLAVKAISEHKDQELLTSLNQFESYSVNAINNAKALNEELDQIDSDSLPQQYREQFLLMRSKATFLSKSLAEFTELIGKLKILVGADEDKRYLLIFQNNAELRASGGFFGSYALIDFSKGKVKNIETPGGGSYDTEAGLRERIIAPKPLHLLNPLWHFWDSNWWPDWPTSAKKIMWFYEKSSGPTVDGVISLTPTVLEELLRATGPVDMQEKYGVTIEADNLWLTLQTFSEQKPDQTKEPKKIVGDLLNKIVAELPGRLNREMIFGLINATEQSLREKQLMLYFKNDNLEQAVEKYGWDGRLKDTKWDYLAVINTNIGGAKTDRKIKEAINHQAELQPDGSIINTVTIDRTHTGLKNEAFSGVRNVDWMRIYTPKGSELIEARGFVAPPGNYFEAPDSAWKNDPSLANELAARTDPITGTLTYEENGKTVFANWSMVDPGQTTAIYLRYKLPFGFTSKESTRWQDKLSDAINPMQKELHPYALLVQKQAGAQPSEFKSRLSVSPNTNNHYSPIWSYPESNSSTLQLDANGWQINDRLDTDKYWAVFLEK